ncbi:peptide/nickel transport system substrate-binding protein [Nitrosospira sp. Nl5]|uniref:ABC transporter substrate-binding protein n=1 Tax=Nitrosospira sp. Nl5 TaxID=200120 RepID=UPI00088816C7|nr:ABC transporter substrate-binding protein [Nitrosospira sp. Nl5]SCY03634.1 peptide/nickel transport system substrate-binding protein [Nitrosospira sp. Nl5]
MRSKMFGLSLAILGLAACGKTPPEPASQTSETSETSQQKKITHDTRPRTLIVARASEPEWLNPVAGHQHADSDLAMFRGLFKVNARNELVSDMARDWQVTPDGRIYTIGLRSGIKWHDGQPFTSQDVKFTLETIQHPKNHSGFRKNLSAIREVEAIDALTVKIHLDKPFAPLLSKLRMGLIPKHVLEGKDFNTDKFNSTSPVGTGPFKLKEWKRGEYLILEANPDFYDGRPKLDQVIYKFLPDPNVRLVQLKKGEVDVAEIKPRQIAAIKPGDNIHLEIVDTADYRVMMFNLRDPLFRDIRVRQAIQYATDRKALVQGALLGHGYPAYGPLQYNKISAPELTGPDDDPKKSEDLLATAGWVRGIDGIFVKNGQKLSFPLTVPANDPVRQDLAALLADQLHRAGIEVRIQVRDMSGIKIPTLPAYVLGGGIPGEPDEDVYAYFSSSNGERGSNYSGYHNPRVDDLLERGRITLDPEARKAIYQQLQTALIEDPPYNYLVYLKHIYGVRKGVSGFSPRVFGHGTSPLWNIEQWDVERNP